MDRVMHDVRVYANDVVDRLNALKDKNRDKLCRTEIETLNDAANLIYKNIGKLTETSDDVVLIDTLNEIIEQKINALKEN